MSIELHIEELVLHGFDPRDRHAIADAVQQELARLVAERGIGGVTAADVPRLDAGTISLATTRGTGSAGPIAEALHSTLTTNTPLSSRASTLSSLDFARDDRP